MPEPTTSSETDAKTRSSDVKWQAVSGVKSLGLRTAFSLGLRIVSSLVLSRLLFPKDYGLFGVAASIAGMGMYLCDIGLAAAIIRKPGIPTEEELSTVFFAQQAITALVVLVIMAASPWLTVFYHLSRTAWAILAWMAIGLFFSSGRIVPVLLLERRLAFKTIAKCELIENVVQTASTIAMAFAGLGAWALAGGGLIRGVVGLVIWFRASPWRPVAYPKVALLRTLAGFGLQFQLNAIVPALFGGWLPLAVSRLLGLTALGYVGWAMNLASVPLTLVSVLNRVAFPAMSRLQSDQAYVGASLQQSIRRLGALLWLVAPLAVIVAPVAIPLLFRSRWLPAVPLMQWLIMEAVLQSLNGMLAMTQNANGYPGDRLIITIIMGAVRAGAGYFCVLRFGMIGIGPLLTTATLLEIAISCFTLRRRNPHCAIPFDALLRPLVIVYMRLGVALLIGRQLGHENPIFSATISLAIFVSLVALSEVLYSAARKESDLRLVLRMMTDRRANTVQS